MPTFFDLVKKSKEKKPDEIKKEIVREISEIINKKRKHSRIEHRKSGRISAWVLGAFYEVLTGRSVRGSRGKILVSLIEALVDFAKENEPSHLDQIKSILNNIE